VDDPAALHGHLASAKALIVRNRTQVREALIGMGPKLKVIGRLGVGLDNIDVEACRARSIQVIPATGANDLSVAEYVITAALDAVARGLAPLVRGCRRATGPGNR
jgi:(S)-sulfolactate dehydrogenase